MFGNVAEKIIKREDGSRVKIRVSPIDYSGNVRYNTSVSTCAPRKRKFNNVINTDNYTWRGLSREQKEDYEIRAHLKVCTKEEILAVRMEAWESMKPTMEDYDNE